jgi:hypothetical protein
MTQTAAPSKRPQWSPAMRRHQLRVWPTLVVYGLVLSADLWLFANRPPSGVLKYLAALAPAVPLLAVVWLFGRYLYEERDEFRRWQQILALLIATALVLSVCIVWGFLQMLAGAAPAPLYHVPTLFVVAHGVAGAFVGWRYR